MSSNEPCENPNGADNEQGSTNIADVAWLAGHFDGEGWIGLHRQRRKESQHTRYSPAIALATTCPKNANRVREVFEDNGVKVSFTLIPEKVTASGNTRREQWEVRIASAKGTRKAIELMMPHLVGKKKQAELVYEYITWRETQPRRPGRFDFVVTQAIQDKGEMYTQLLKDDRRWGYPSTTTRLAPATAG